MTTSRARVLAALQHRTADRIPVCETGLWPEAVQRWRAEGLPQDADPHMFFQLDRIVTVGPFHSQFFPHEIYEETDDYCIDQNGYGTVSKWFKNAGSSGGHIELEHRIQTIQDWREARKRLTVSDDRFKDFKTSHPAEFVTVAVIDHFWFSFVMCGMENLCCWLIQAPAEMHEIYNDYLDFLIGMLDRTLARHPNFNFDALWFFSDMAYHSGPMFSPRTFNDVIAPGYRRLREWCDRNGKYMLLHCDGNISELLPAFIDVGFDWLHPLEARAGNDVRELKQDYGHRITLMGNINADVLARGDMSEIEDEVASKVSIAKVNGGYLYNSDHSVPPTVSFASFQHAINTAKAHGQF